MKQLAFQVSNLCIGERPTTVSVDILSNNDDMIASFDDVILSQDTTTNLLSAYITFTVLADQQHTAKVLLHNCGGDFNIRIIKNISEFYSITCK